MMLSPANQTVSSSHRRGPDWWQHGADDAEAKRHGRTAWGFTASCGYRGWLKVSKLKSSC